MTHSGTKRVNMNWSLEDCNVPEMVLHIDDAILVVPQGKEGTQDKKNINKPGPNFKCQTNLKKKQ